MPNEGEITNTELLKKHIDEASTYLTEEQRKELTQHLSARVVHQFYKEIANNAVVDFVRIKYDNADEQFKMVAKSNYLKGAIEALDILINVGNRR